MINPFKEDYSNNTELNTDIEIMLYINALYGKQSYEVKLDNNKKLYEHYEIANKYFLDINVIQRPCTEEWNTYILIISYPKIKTDDNQLQNTYFKVLELLTTENSDYNMDGFTKTNICKKIADNKETCFSYSDFNITDIYHLCLYGNKYGLKWNLTKDNLIVTCIQDKFPKPYIFNPLSKEYQIMKSLLKLHANLTYSHIKHEKLYKVFAYEYFDHIHIQYHAEFLHICRTFLHEKGFCLSLNTHKIESHMGNFTTKMLSVKKITNISLL